MDYEKGAFGDQTDINHKSSIPMKNDKINEGDKTIQELEIALDIIQASAMKMRAGSLPNVQLHRMFALLSLVIEVIKFEHTPGEGPGRLN